MGKRPIPTTTSDPAWLRALSSLPPRIWVEVRHEVAGALHLKPVSKRNQHLVGLTNRYDSRCSVLLQVDTDVEQFYQDFPQCRDNLPCRIKIDSWTYRHMVGGQSD